MLWNHEKLHEKVKKEEIFFFGAKFDHTVED